LCTLATNIPAAIVADLLSIHLNAAVRWVHLLLRDWTGYLASRAENLQARNSQ